MKKIILSISIFLLILITACDDKFGLGKDILPNEDLTNLQMTDTFEIFMYTEKAPPKRTDNPAYLFIGNHNEQFFGNSTAEFMTQVLQSSYPNFGDTTVLDSICLVLPLDDENYYYGNEDARLNLSVYEVTEDTLKSSKDYYSNENPEDYINFNKIGSGLTYLTHILYTNEEEEEFDTLAISLRLNDDLGQLFIDSNQYYFHSIGKFSNIFKGIYVKFNDDAFIGNDETCIYKIRNDVPSTTSNFGIVMYYHYENDDTPRKYALPINGSAIQFNMFSHDYSESEFAEQMENPGTIDDSVAYLQSMAGTFVRIEIPGLKNFTDVVINKAELVIENASTDFYGEYDPLKGIWLSGFDSDTNIVYLQEFMGNSYEGATINSDNEYHFFVTKLVQDIIAGKFENQNIDIYLSVINSGSDFNRSVITTGKNTNPSKLVVTYMKYR